MFFVTILNTVENTGENMGSLTIFGYIYINFSFQGLIWRIERGGRAEANRELYNQINHINRPISEKKIYYLLKTKLQIILQCKIYYVLYQSVIFKNVIQYKLIGTITC